MNFNTVHTQLDDGAHRVDSSMMPFHPEADQLPVDYKLYDEEEEPPVESGPKAPRGKGKK